MRAMGCRDGHNVVLAGSVFAYLPRWVLQATGRGDAEGWAVGCNGTVHRGKGFVPRDFPKLCPPGRSDAWDEFWKSTCGRNSTYKCMHVWESVQPSETNVAGTLRRMQKSKHRCWHWNHEWRPDLGEDLNAWHWPETKGLLTVVCQTVAPSDFHAGRGWSGAEQGWRAARTVRRLEGSSWTERNTDCMETSLRHCGGGCRGKGVSAPESAGLQGRQICPRSPLQGDGKTRSSTS